jgi:hypothetical protein
MGRGRSNLALVSGGESMLTSWPRRDGAAMGEETHSAAGIHPEATRLLLQKAQRNLDPVLPEVDDGRVDMSPCVLQTLGMEVEPRSLRAV